MYPHSSASRKRTASYEERPPSSYTRRPIHEYTPTRPSYTPWTYDVDEERGAGLMSSLRSDDTFTRNSPSPPPNRYNPQAPPYTPASPRDGPEASPYMPTYGPQTGPISKYEPRAPAYSPEMDPKSAGYVPYTERTVDSSLFSPSYGPSFPSYTPVRRDTDRPDFDLREDLNRIRKVPRASNTVSGGSPYVPSRRGPSRSRSSMNDLASPEEINALEHDLAAADTPFRSDVVLPVTRTGACAYAWP
jgi:hypothetical protein